MGVVRQCVTRRTKIASSTPRPLRLRQFHRLASQRRMHASSSYTATSTMPCTTCNILSCSNHPHTLHAQSAHCQARIILIHCKRTVSCTACNTYWGTSHPHTIQAQSALPVSHCQAHLILYPMYIAHIFILIHYKCNQLIVSYYTACNTLSGTHHPYI